MTAAPQFLPWLTDKIGPNWVVARRTPRILAQYGGDVVALTQKQFREYQSEYRALYGDPNDPQRAELYRALRDARDNGLIYWDPNTTRGCIAKMQMLARIDGVLADEAAL